MNPPLHIKFRTGEKTYFYDVSTGSIIEVNDVEYSVLDDFHRIPLQEIVDRNVSFTPEKIRKTYADMEAQQKTNHFLIDHEPAKAEEVGEVVFQKKRHTLTEFLKTHSSMMILGITERCNLRCEYCCYSGQFEGWRTHGSGSISFETAQKAIHDHLCTKQPDNLCAISFYGGEPLLEFDLLKDSVLYAEREALKFNKKPTFTITTNGTLLNDEIMQFLVEHEFLVMISLDGPKEVHDRYRVYTGNDHRKGSFDTVMKNIDRFKELAPDYRKRGLSMTLAPPILWNETEALITKYFPYFPMTRVSLVNMDGRKDRPDRRNCSDLCDCRKGEPATIELEMSNSDDQILQREFAKYQKALYEHSVEELLPIMPLHSMLFSPALRSIHERLVTSRPLPHTFIVPCLPGFSRRFCDINGNYYPCERVENSKRFLLGNVDIGYDAESASRLMRWFNETGDCANCVSVKTCNLCYAAIHGSDSELPLVRSRLESSCHRVNEATPPLLHKYVEIVERNPQAFDTNETNENPKENNQITFLPKTESIQE